MNFSQAFIKSLKISGKKTRNICFALCAGFLLFVMTILLPNLPLFSVLLGSYADPVLALRIAGGLLIAGYLVVGPWVYGITILLSIIFALNIFLLLGLWAKVMEQRKLLTQSSAQVKVVADAGVIPGSSSVLAPAGKIRYARRISSASFGGAILAFLGYGCASCGVGVLAAFLSATGLSGAAVFLTIISLPLSVLALMLSMYSAYKLVRILAAS